MNETRRAILESIADGPIAGPTLAESLDVSRAAVWKHVEGLRADGFEIESGPDGYVLARVPTYNGPAIEFGLDAPFSIEYHEELESTNDRARDRASGGATDAVVVAEEMTGGRGRLDREWTAPAGGCWLSIVDRPSIPPTRAPLFTLAAAVATARTAREAGVDARIKWPNDVVVPTDDGGSVLGPTDDGTPYRKLAGVLTEMEGETDRVEWIVVGVGVNANVDASALPAGATSVREEVGDVDRRRFVQRLLETFDDLRADLQSVVPAWRELTLTLGQRVRVEAGDSTVVGEAQEVTAGGALVVDDDDRGRVTVAAGDCTHLRPAR